MPTFYVQGKDNLSSGQQLIRTAIRRDWKLAETKSGDKANIIVLFDAKILSKLVLSNSHLYVVILRDEVDLSSFTDAYPNNMLFTCRKRLAEDLQKFFSQYAAWLTEYQPPIRPKRLAVI